MTTMWNLLCLPELKDVWLSVQAKITGSSLQPMPPHRQRASRINCLPNPYSSSFARPALITSKRESSFISSDTSAVKPPPNLSAASLTLWVQFLDTSEHSFSVDRKSQGCELINRVFRHLDLSEPKYFGLLYRENESYPGSTRWLDPDKPVRKQLKGTSRLYFRVKFFSARPEQLCDEFTRYLYMLQLRREIRLGNVYVDRDTAVKLAALLMQADFGDYEVADMNKVYARVDAFIPLQGQDFLKDVRKEHALLRGMSASSADLRYLHIAKSLDMYGVELHQAVVTARDSADMELKIGVCNKGIVIFQGFQKISAFNWDKIAKISFRRRQFTICLIPDASYEEFPARLLLINSRDDFTVSLTLPSYRASKALWKSCVEHHSFFRDEGSDASLPRPNCNGGSQVEPFSSLLQDYQTRATSNVRMAFQRCLPTKLSNRGVEDRYSNDHSLSGRDQFPTDEVNFYVMQNAHCQNDRYSTGQASPESHRFPSPSPSRVSLYSSLAQPLASAKTEPASPLHSRRSHHSLHRPAPCENHDENKSCFLMPQNTISSLIRSAKTNSVNGDDMSCDASHSPTIDNTAEACLKVSINTLRKDLRSSAIMADFEKLYRSKPGYTFNVGRRHDNFYKNRYKDVLPYDQTRVTLRNGCDGDYINANYVNMPIHTADIVNKYIATQGPLPTTSDDFWQMVWEQNISLIVMLTTLHENGRIKCHKYWADVGDCIDFGRFQLCTKKETRSLDQHTIHRELQFVRKDVNEERTICQAQCESWPDHGVPSDYTSFIEFVQWIRRRRAQCRQSSVLVHCSAGIGRTGVIILAETALCLMEQNLPVYPIDIVKQMRDQRYSMIQTREQFQFACEAIVYAHRRKNIVGI